MNYVLNAVANVQGGGIKLQKLTPTPLSALRFNPQCDEKRTRGSGAVFANFMWTSFMDNPLSRRSSCCDCRDWTGRGLRHAITPPGGATTLY